MLDIKKFLPELKTSVFLLKLTSIVVVLSVINSSPGIAVFGLECRKPKSAASELQKQLRELNSDLQKYTNELNLRVRFFTKEEKASRLKQCLREAGKKSDGLKPTRLQCDQMWNPKYRDRFPQCFDEECEKFSSLVLATNQKLEAIQQKYDYVIMGNDKCFDPRTVAEVRIRNGVKS